MLYAEFGILEVARRLPSQMHLGLKRGWRANGQEGYKNSIEKQLGHCGNLDAVILPTQVTAKSHESPRPSARPRRGAYASGAASGSDRVARSTCGPDQPLSQVTPDMLCEELCRMRPGKCPGADGLVAEAIRE